MNKIADAICAILSDYHAHSGFNFDRKHVLTWVDQFAIGDRQFILEEFLHLLNQGIYINMHQGENLLLAHLQNIAKTNKFPDIKTLLAHVCFLNIQPNGKSQAILLRLLDSLLLVKYNTPLSKCGTISKKYVIYLDDILATGNTVYSDFNKWLQVNNLDGQTNSQKVQRKEIIPIICLFGACSWGAHNAKVRLKIAFGDGVMNAIQIKPSYLIENNPTLPQQKFNFAYPIDVNDKAVGDYYRELVQKLDLAYPTSAAKTNYPYRKPHEPAIEGFYSSPNSRSRFEGILLSKGIEILNKVGHMENNHRPLGVTNPSKKNLGTGTLFFTWRNVSNTTPIVFWWKTYGSNWYPLFPLTNRGQN